MSSRKHLSFKEWMIQIKGKTEREVDKLFWGGEKQWLELAELEKDYRRWRKSGDLLGKRN